MNYQQYLAETRDSYQEKLIEEISRLFTERGIQPMRMTDLAVASGVGVASLYRYFGTKKNLVILCGMNLWTETIHLFDSVFETELYRNQKGIDQMEDLLKVYHVLYTGHREFLKFLADFDAFCIHEHVTVEELKDYENNIMNTLPLFAAAYEKGHMDHTIKCTDDVNTLYFTITHSLMCLAQKMLPENQILSSDSVIDGEEQINLLIRIHIAYLKGK